MGKLLELKPAVKNRAAIIDEYGNVERLRKEFAPYEKRYKALREEIAGWYDDETKFDPKSEYTEKGLRYQIDVGACARERNLPIKAVHKALGLAKFLRIASVTLKALAQFLTEPEIEALVIETRTGPRSIGATPIVAVPTEAALPKAA